MGDTTPAHGAPPDLGPFARSSRRRLLAGGRRRVDCARRRHGADPGRRLVRPESAYEQAQLCLAIIADALGAPGSSLDDVVRTRMFITDPAHWAETSRAPTARCSRTAARGDLRGHVAARPVLEGRDRGGGGDRVTQAADPVRHHRQGRLRDAGLAGQRARPQVRPERSVHARRRGGVPAARRSTRSTSSSTSTRCSPRSRATSSSTRSTPS